MDTVSWPALTLKDQVGTETGMVAFLLGPPGLLTRKPSEGLVWKFCHSQVLPILSCDLLPPFSRTYSSHVLLVPSAPPSHLPRWERWDITVLLPAV